ncbi:hypothetical protein ACIQ6K_40540 [Streptomyces sp. NPDC096354]|uniref:hypothetical protein n=1 Tax=Streptomyces sp. NPDC096354 TaxID=3366088 RepID=UPI0037F64887
MATRTRNQGSDWLALASPDPVKIHRAWEAGELTHLPSGQLWLAAEADLRRSVEAMQRVGPEQLGPVLVFPSAELAWWLVPCNADDELADLAQLTLRPKGWMLRCPPADRYVDGWGWLEKPDGSGLLTDPTVLSAAFELGGRLLAAAFC